MTDMFHSERCEQLVELMALLWIDLRSQLGLLAGKGTESLEPDSGEKILRARVLDGLRVTSLDSELVDLCHNMPWCTAYTARAVRPSSCPHVVALCLRICCASKLFCRGQRSISSLAHV